MTILVTNDDGYTKGLKILLSTAKSLDEKSYAIIPHRPRSGVSKAITLHKPLRVKERQKDLYELTGTPADCSSFSLFCKDFKSPKLVLSGINWGDNTSLHSIYTSGTLAACIEATLFNIPSIGFSMYKKKHKWREKEKEWGDAQILQNHILKIIKLIKPHFEKNLIFSVNLPDSLGCKEIVFAEPQRHRYEVKIEKRIDPEGKPYYWFTGPHAEQEKGKDFDFVLSGKTVITPLSIIPTDFDKLNALKSR